MLADTSNPSFDNTPNVISDITCDASLPTQQTLTATDDCGSATVVASVDAYTVDNCAGYTVTYRWTATDDCGNSGVVTESFNVLADTSNPSFNNTPNAISDINCDASLPTQQTLTATDDCGSAIVVASVDAYTVDNCAGYTVTYRWTATDDCGNSTEVTESFNVLADTSNPSFDNTPNAISDITCDASLPTQQTLTATDDCGSASVVASVDAYTVDNCAGYTVTYRWVATDDCGNSSAVTESFNVLADTSNPSFDNTPNTISDITCDASLPTQQTLTATDDCGSATVVSSVDAYTVDNCAGYTVTYRWTATDDCGNSSVVTESFNVLADTSNPSFDNTPNTISDITCDASLPAQQTLTASDDCGSATVVASVDAYTVDNCAGYTVTYRWTATDDCGNSSVVTESFNVLADTSNPSFDNTPNAISDITCDTTLPTQQTLTATDDCGSASVVASVDAYTVDNCAGYTVTYRWVATDDCGNSIVVTESFNVLADTSNPSFDNTPNVISDITCDGSLPTQQTLTPRMIVEVPRLFQV